MSRNAHDLKIALTGRIEEVVRHLLPAAERSGNYWHVGSVAGEPGKSLSICASGPKAGLWLDGATADDKGDLLDLWAAVRGNRGIKPILGEVREWLGIPAFDHRRSKSYKAPSLQKEGRPIPPARSAIRNYLSVDRKIDPKLIAEFKIQERAWGNPAMVFPCIKPDGSVAMLKYLELARSPRGKKIISCSPDSEPYLFGLHTRLARESDTIVICEGEIDAMSWQQHGVAAASVPFGAKGESSGGGSPNDEWIENCFAELDDYRTIMLSMDMDEEGQAARDALVKRFGRDRCMVIDLPKKDANECHVAGLDLASLARRARAVEPDGFASGSSLASRVISCLEGGERRLQGIPFMGWEGFEFRLRPREGTLVTGFNGGGKSNACYQLLAWLACKHGKRSFIGSYEEPVDQILAIMANHAAGRQLGSGDPEMLEVKSRLLDNVFVHDYEGSVPALRYFDMAEHACRKYGVEFCLLDSATCTDVNLDDKEEMDEFARRCQAFWKRTGCHMILIAHPRKGLTEAVAPGKMDVKGSGGLTDLFFNGVTVHRAAAGKTEVSVWKQKVGGRLPRRVVAYDWKSARLVDTENNETTQTWLT